MEKTVRRIPREVTSPGNISQIYGLDKHIRLNKKELKEKTTVVFAVELLIW